MTKKKRGFSENGNGSGGRTICPRGLSFSQFVILMSTINAEKDSPLGQTVLPPEPFPFFENPQFFPTSFTFIKSFSVYYLVMQTENMTAGKSNYSTTSFSYTTLVYSHEILVKIISMIMHLMTIGRYN